MAGINIANKVVRILVSGASENLSEKRNSLLYDLRQSPHTIRHMCIGEPGVISFALLYCDTQIIPVRITFARFDRVGVNVSMYDAEIHVTADDRTGTAMRVLPADTHHACLFVESRDSWVAPGFRNIVDAVTVLAINTVRGVAPNRNVANPIDYFAQPSAQEQPVAPDADCASVTEPTNKPAATVDWPAILKELVAFAQFKPVVRIDVIGGTLTLEF